MSIDRTHCNNWLQKRRGCFGHEWSSVPEYVCCTTDSSNSELSVPVSRNQEFCYSYLQLIVFPFLNGGRILFLAGVRTFQRCDLKHRKYLYDGPSFLMWDFVMLVLNVKVFWSENLGCSGLASWNVKTWEMLTKFCPPKISREVPSGSYVLCRRMKLGPKI